ncbi:hypothetical protein BJY52DRAFT_1255916 [Lactarius psammicola]|nr:hypothetical protein BJY52DRAFT_1255916 [Lactarius psammicola]
MHASHVAILVLAASAASPALSAPLTYVSRARGTPSVRATSNVVARDASPLAARDGDLFIRDLNDFFQSIPTISGPLKLQNPNIVNAEGSSPPAPALVARTIVDDAFNAITQLIPTNLLGRDGVDDFVQGIYRRVVDGACDPNNFLSNPIFVPPIGACDAELLAANFQNLQLSPDLVTRDFSAVFENVRRIFGPDFARRDVTPEQLIAIASRSLSSLD